MTELDREIVLSIYDTVADQTRWTDVLDSVCQHLNAKGCLIFEYAEETGLAAPFYSSMYSEQGLKSYFAYHEDLEVADQQTYLDHCNKTDQVEIISDNVLYSDVEEFKKRPHVQHVMQFGILHRAAVYLNKDNLNLNRFSIQFGSDRGNLTPDERAELNALLPHISKALDLGRPAKQLARNHKSILAAMDLLTIGVCVLDARGRIAHSNEEFKRQQQAFNVFIVQRDGQLLLSRQDDQKRFIRLKSDAMNHGRYGARPRKEAVTADYETYLCIEVAPLTKPDEMGTKPFDGFILYSSDTSRPVHCNALPMKRLYKLTDAELSVVDMIAEGLTNRQIAERRDRSVATVNAQVKAILSKTQCSTRTQFVRMMMSFGADHIIESPRI